MVHGNPLTIPQVYQWIIASWVTGIVLAAIYFIGDLVGPYKVREAAHACYSGT
jgi:hypothetical protein